MNCLNHNLTTWKSWSNLFKLQSIYILSIYSLFLKRLVVVSNTNIVTFSKSGLLLFLDANVTLGFLGEAERPD